MTHAPTNGAGVRGPGASACHCAPACFDLTDSATGQALADVVSVGAIVNFSRRGAALLHRGELSL